ncbi:MAG TPA: DUF1592 domain-containing protein [Pirellulaceae bacterium]
MLPVLVFVLFFENVESAEPPITAIAQAVIKQYCLDCHNAATAEGQINLEQMTAQPTFDSGFKNWRKVAAMLETERMPPKDAEQPPAEERQHLAKLVRDELQKAADQNSGDPGDVVLRRLTSAEYSYAIQDLVGLDLDLDREFVSDAAGGEGFTNVGTVQFLDDSGLERYLQAAKKVADHAVIGSGPLQFFIDPGKTGLELSAISRIRQIYREYGFRTAAGEGGVPFGLDRYPKAFFAAWKYQHREALGLKDASLSSCAADEGLSSRFVEHVYSVLTSPSLSFPTAEIATRWKQVPTPQGNNGYVQEVRAKCDELYGFMSDWQIRLARAVGDDEEAPILSENTIQVQQKHSFVARFAWMEPPTNTRVQFAVLSGNPSRNVDSVVIWKNPRLRFRRLSRRRDEPQPITDFLTRETIKPFAFGQHPRGGDIGPFDFVTIGADSRSFDIDVPEGARGLEVTVEVELDLAHGEDCVVRCSIIEGDDPEKLKTNSALLANPSGKPFQDWKAGVIEFARLLPQVSHREAAPSDRDPIPFPFENTYNTPERNFFHTAVKYHRDDRFLVEYLLDGAARKRLDTAWSDLLGSFEYHDILLRFTAEKYKLDLEGRTIANVDGAWIDHLQPEPGAYIRQLHRAFVGMKYDIDTAEPRHLADVLTFANRAWRRPLTDDEASRLTSFYREQRTSAKLDHSLAIRALITRVLVAPEFLYRAERSNQSANDVALSNDELAGRLSFLIWSSLPDKELRRAAAVGELQDANHLARQALRMLHDPKGRRFAGEFFGQWLSFYQFDRYRGVDGEKFPEFNDRLRASLYDEATTFFEHIVRTSRPVNEILFADYAFVNDDLAQHYSLKAPHVSGAPRQMKNVVSDHRGGLMGLGAVLTVTSAPLRTSPVKRGDWILRRVLGTPVPPPPANAGSIAADDSPADGKTVRQRLEAHRSDAACVNCHSRIDPLGFALEHYDLLGRWRETYTNGDPIDDAISIGDGPSVAGPEGLRAYLRQHQEQFYQTLCSKLLAYSLGRGELVTDAELMEKMAAKVRSGEGTMSDLVVEIVSSRQFRERRNAGYQQKETKVTKE